MVLETSGGQIKRGLESTSLPSADDIVIPDINEFVTHLYIAASDVKGNEGFAIDFRLPSTLRIKRDKEAHWLIFQNTPGKTYIIKQS
jgi:hypothetical protein